MKTRLLGAFAVSALLGTALATASFAQDRQRGFDGPRGERAGQMRGGPRGRGADAQPERFIERFDSDADGRVSAAEFADERLQRIDRLFEHRDADGDGLITADEHAAPRGLRGREGRGPGGPRAERLGVDRDAVAACVRETIADYLPPQDDEADTGGFDRLDANGDGQLTLQEASASIEARAQELFAHIDADGDAYITDDEAGAHLAVRQEARRAAQACVREQMKN